MLNIKNGEPNRFYSVRNEKTRLVHISWYNLYNLLPQPHIFLCGTYAISRLSCTIRCRSQMCVHAWFFFLQSYRRGTLHRRKWHDITHRYVISSSVNRKSYIFSYSHSSSPISCEHTLPDAYRTACSITNWTKQYKGSAMGSPVCYGTCCTRRGKPRHVQSHFMTQLEFLHRCTFAGRHHKSLNIKTLFTTSIIVFLVIFVSLLRVYSVQVGLWIRSDCLSAQMLDSS